MTDENFEKAKQKLLKDKGIDLNLIMANQGERVILKEIFEMKELMKQLIIQIGALRREVKALRGESP